MGQVVKPDGIGVRVGVAVINAIHFGGFDNHIRSNFSSSQGSGSICGKIRVAGSPAKNNDPALFEMADGPAADVRLGDRAHFNGRLNACQHPKLLQGIHQCQRIHHRCQHAHIIGRSPIHSGILAGGATPKVAGTNNNRHVHPHLMNALHQPGNYASLGWVNAKSIRTGQ